MVKEMVQYDNKARAENGKPSLGCSGMLGDIALEWSKGQCACAPRSADACLRLCIPHSCSLSASR